MTELRRQVRGTQSRYVVVKNTLALRAVKGTALEAMSEHFRGPTAVAYNSSNAVALAKVLTAFAKANPNLVFKGALVDGRPVAAAQIQAIADLPSREELVSPPALPDPVAVEKARDGAQRAGPQPGRRRRPDRGTEEIAAGRSGSSGRQLN